MSNLLNQKGNAVIILSIAISVILMVVIAWVFVSKSQSKVPTPQKSQINNQSSDEPSSVSNPMGQEAIIKADTSKDGPWQRDLHIAISNEGKDFRDDKVFEKKAGVPSIIHDKQGKLYAAFQWFPDDNPKSFDKVAIKTSTDGGQTWTDPTPAVFNNYPSDFSRPFDPTLVLTPEGKIRMYYTVNKEPAGKLANETSFYSAISDDGINYTFEEGARFAVAGVTLVDSAGAVYNDTYFLLGPKKGGGAYFATSPDGLNFTQGKDISSPSTYNWTGNTLSFDNVIRFYGNSNGPGGKIFYSQTSDGITWSTPIQTNIQGGDPSVVQALESIYLMIYVGGNKK